MSNQVPGSDLPGWFRMLIIGTSMVALVGNVIADGLSSTYDGQFESMILAGIVAGGIAVERLARRGD